MEGRYPVWSPDSQAIALIARDSENQWRWSVQDVDPALPRPAVTGVAFDRAGPGHFKITTILSEEEGKRSVPVLDLPLLHEGALRRTNEYPPRIYDRLWSLFLGKPGSVQPVP